MIFEEKKKGGLNFNCVRDSFGGSFCRHSVFALLHMWSSYDSISAIRTTL
jgi:hypothetical protein